MSEPPDQPVWIPHLEGHAKAIGYVCIVLAELEIGIGGLIHHLGGFQSFDESHIFNAHIDLKGKLEVLRALGIMKKPSDLWFETLEAMVLEIKAISQERNRIVHDAWTEMDDAVYRYRQVTQIKKPQSFQPPVLTTMERVPVS